MKAKSNGKATNYFSVDTMASKSVVTEGMLEGLRLQMLVATSTRRLMANVASQLHGAVKARDPFLGINGAMVDTAGLPVQKNIENASEEKDSGVRPEPQYFGRNTERSMAFHLLKFICCEESGDPAG